ncbi:MAG TPA: hypothetical protein VE641_20425 [Chthoniobacterales bacterium]|nr:hypothetical protein [Chthoniobacterales bacterium]
MTRSAFALCFILLLLSNLGMGQWNPPESLRSIPVRNDCKKTHGLIGLSSQPSLFNPHGIIFLCPDRAAAIDQRHPGASFFFRVHEYGHLALGTRDEAAADAWAAEQLNQSDAGRVILRAVLAHFADIGEKFAPYYGTGFYRGLNVATTAGIDRKEWPETLVAYQRKWEDRLKRNGSISFRSKEQSVFDGLVVIDGDTLGFFDTMYADRSLALPALKEGKHELSLVNVWSYQIGQNRRLLALVRGMNTTASFTISNTGALVGYISGSESDLSVIVKGPQ